ncbi:CNNM, transmembrane domain [Sesbania bispinosa]|nr:CNNM, transmembrane domain [Sesbania bispinosa]
MQCVLVTLAGIASGLALGLLSFSQVDLEVLIKAGRPKDRKHAERIQPLVKNGHFVLCTLLLGKSLAMEALPIFMDAIIPAWFTILMSAPLVTVFVEILPQAVCSRYGLTLGATMAPVIQLLLLIFFPITYPASKVLDWALGKEHSVLLRRSELKTFVDLHANEAGKGGELSHHETSIITGAMDLTQKTAKDAMTPISETFSLDINSKLDMHTMTQIMSKGHSRIPIHSGHPTNIVGLILVKNLIFSRPEDETPIKNLIIRKIPRVYETWPLYEILNQFKKGHSHMAVVLKSNMDTENTATHAVGTPTILNIITKKLSNQAQISAESIPSYVLEMSQTSSIHEPTLYSSEMEFHSPTLEHVMDLDNQESRQCEQEIGYITQEQIESLSAVLDEEVIGIITMEDVMEELLQEEKNKGKMG